MHYETRSGRALLNTYSAASKRLRLKLCSTRSASVERSDFVTFGKQFCQSGFQGGSFDHQSGRNLLIVGIFGK
jgi:hypothetical protein